MLKEKLNDVTVETIAWYKRNSMMLQGKLNDVTGKTKRY